MTRCQVAQGNQNKMAKLPRTSLRPKTIGNKKEIVGEVAWGDKP